LEWLSWLEISNHIEIQHAFNQGEKVIGSRQMGFAKKQEQFTSSSAVTGMVIRAH